MEHNSEVEGFGVDNLDLSRLSHLSEDVIIEDTPVADVSGEIEIKEEDDTDGNTAATASNTTPASTFKLIAELLKTKGIINEVPDDLEDSDDALASLVEKAETERITRGIEDFKESLPEELKYLVQNYQDGVNIMDLISKERQIQEFSSITSDDLSDESVQKELIREYYVRQGYSKDRIGSKLEKLDASGMLAEEAKDSLDALVKIEKREKEDLIKTQRDSKRLFDDQEKADMLKLETEINDKKGAILDLEWSKEDKRKIYAALSKPIGKDKNGRPVNAIGKYIQENPDFKYVIADLIVLRNGKLDAIKSKLNTAITNKTKNNVNSPSRPSILSDVDVSVVKRALGIK